MFLKTGQQLLRTQRETAERDESLQMSHNLQL